MPDLAKLLAEAEAADNASRVSYRDRIAAYGEAAVEQLRPWLHDRRLTGFAVRTIGQAAAHGAQAAAIQTLVEARAEVGPTTREDIDWQLSRLGWKPPVAPTTRRRDAHEPSPVPPGAGGGWPGFQEHEFGVIKGTAWRSRDGRARPRAARHAATATPASSLCAAG